MDVSALWPEGAHAILRRASDQCSTPTYNSTQGLQFTKSCGRVLACQSGTWCEPRQNVDNIQSCMDMCSSASRKCYAISYFLSTRVCTLQYDSNTVEVDSTTADSAIADVSQLSTEWKEHTEIWTKDELRKACTRHTDRSVKHALLQNIIWTVLLEHVFCSPFRMFGKAGRQLEKEWNDVCVPNRSSQNKSQRESLPYSISTQSERYTPPPPSVQAERWRYMTLIGCHDAMEFVLSSQDPRAAVKRGWAKTQGDMANDMKAEVCKVINAQDIKSSQIERICGTAARVWLNLVMHRCRIELSLMGSDRSSTEKLLHFNKYGSLKLTKSPSLGRHGNPRGGELETFTIIADCAGDSVLVP